MFPVCSNLRPFPAIQAGERCTIVILKISAGSVPPGFYSTKFAGVEAVNNGQFGPGLKFKFVIARGPLVGQTVSRTTGCTPSQKNNLGKLLSGMLGRTLNVDEEVDVDDLLGREFMVVVGVSENGGSRVESATPPPTE